MLFWAKKQFQSHQQLRILRLNNHMTNVKMIIM